MRIASALLFGRMIFVVIPRAKAMLKASPKGSEDRCFNSYFLGSVGPTEG